MVCHEPPDPRKSRLNVHVKGCLPLPMPCSAAKIGTRFPPCSAEENCSPKP